MHGTPPEERRDHLAWRASEYRLGRVRTVLGAEPDHGDVSPLPFLQASDFVGEPDGARRLERAKAKRLFRG